jgi:hypothetical protein
MQLSGRRVELAIYELTLIRPGHEPETRFTDRRPVPGQTIQIDGRPATVTSCTDNPTNEVAVERFVCTFAGTTHATA